MGWKPYARAVAAASSLFTATLVTSRLIDLTIVTGLPVGRASGFIMLALGGDVALAIAFGSLAGGVAVRRTGLPASSVVLPTLCAATAVFVMSSLVGPLVEQSVATGLLGADPSRFFPLGPHTPWTLAEMAAATSAGTLPVPNVSVASAAMANLYLFEASLPLSLTVLTGVNSGAGLMVGTFRGSLSPSRGCWFVSLLTSASYLAGARLALVLAGSDVVPVLTIVALPLAVPVSVAFTLALTATRSWDAD